MTYKFVIGIETYNKINNYKKYLERYGVANNAGSTLQYRLKGIKPSALSLEEFTLRLVDVLTLDPNSCDYVDIDTQIKNNCTDAEGAILKDFSVTKIEDQTENNDSFQKEKIILMVQAEEGDPVSFNIYEGRRKNEQQQVHAKNKEATANLGDYFHPLSPFAELFETSTYPHARSMRTSFKQKFIDSYYVLAGRMPILEDKAHFGLFDYLTVGIPAALLLSLYWSFDRGYWPLTILLAIINLPFIAVRVIFGVVTASVFSFVTGITSLITSYLAGETYKDALELKGTLANGNEQTLREFLVDNELDIEKVGARIKQTPREDKSADQNWYALELGIKNEDPFSSMRSAAREAYYDHEDDSVPTPAPFTFKFSTDNKSNAMNLHAFFALNVGNVVTDIEGSSELSPESKLDILGIK